MAVLGISALTYFGVSATIEANIERRLVSEMAKLETVISGRIESYSGALFNVRAFILTAPTPGEQAFRQFIERAELQHRFPGLRGIGYSEAFSSRDGQLTSSLKSYEPLDARAKRVLGLNVLAIPERAKLVNSAFESGRAVLSGLMDPVINKGTDPYLQIFLAIEPTGKPVAAGDRWLHATFKVPDFFHTAFGAPSLISERINWRIEESGRLVYDRFDAPGDEIDASRAIEREVTLMGRNFHITVAPLFHFLTWTERYLAWIAAAFAAVLATLLATVFLSNRRQLVSETLNKEHILAQKELISQQAKNLELLNRFSRSVAEELNEENLLAHFLSVIREAEIDFAYLFLSGAGSEGHLTLHSWVGVEDISVLPERISYSFMKQVMMNRYTLTKEHQIMGPSLSRLLGPYSRAEDWIVSVIPTRQRTDQLLMVAGNLREPFSRLQKELLDNVISHVGLGVDKINLIESAQISSRSKSAFLANMSHEIRTPLNALMGFSEMLAGKQLSDVRRLSIANSIRKNSEYLTRLIDDVLDLSKIEAGKLKIHHRRIRLANLLSEVKSVIDLKASEKNLRFEIRAGGLLPTDVFVDDVRLKQILLNVCGNAVKFTNQGSVRVAVSCRKRGENFGDLIFYVEDTGLGISEEAQKNLFKPFSQGDETTTRKFGGSGLGLALSSRLANELGGSLRLIRSLKEVGSVFEIVVPTGDLRGVEWTESLVIPQPHNYPQVVPDAVASRLDGIRILLVEDSLDNQEIFTFFLKNAGAQVEVVENGRDAVERASTESFDLILMDIQIPGIDGKEATRRLRAKGCMTTIVALTAHAMREEKDSCIQAGCDGQITKPIGEREFIEAVAGYLSRPNVPRLAVEFNHGP